MAKYLSVKDVSKAKGLSEWYIRKLLREGQIKGAKKFGRNWRIPRDQLHEIPSAQEIKEKQLTFIKEYLTQQLGEEGLGDF